MNAAPTTPANNSDVAIFARLLQNSKRQMSHSLARYVLTLGFTDEDQAHMTDLAERNQVAELSPSEKEELFHYVKAGHLLALLHSQARRALNKKVS